MLNWMDKVSIYDKIYLLLILLATIVLLLRGKGLSFNIKILSIFTTAHFLTEFSSLYVHYGIGLINHPIYHAFSCISYIQLSAFFYYTFQSKYLKRLLLGSVPAYTLLSLLYLILWEPITEYPSLAFMTEHFLVIVWCFIFYYNVLNYKEPYRPEKDRTFWIITGLLFYFTGNFFIATFYNYIEDHRRDYLTTLYYAGYVFNYLLYVNIIIAILINLKNKQYEQFIRL